MNNPLTVTITEETRSSFTHITIDIPSLSLKRATTSTRMDLFAGAGGYRAQFATQWDSLDLDNAYYKRCDSFAESTSFCFNRFRHHHLSVDEIRERIDALNAAMDRTSDVDFLCLTHTLSYATPLWRKTAPFCDNLLDSSWLESAHDMTDRATVKRCVSFNGTSWQGRLFKKHRRSLLHKLSQWVGKRFGSLRTSAFRPRSRSFLVATHSQGSDADTVCH